MKLLQKNTKLIIILTFTFTLPLSLYSQQLNWTEYRNEEANIGFNIPEGFEIYEKVDSINRCKLSMTFLYESESSDEDAEDIIELSAEIEITLTDEEYDKGNRNNRFFWNDSQWIAQSFGYGPVADSEAKIVESKDWFGLEATTFARYYYVSGGCATAAGEAYSFFAIKALEDDCKVYLSFNDYGATNNNIGKMVISSMRRIK